LGAPASRPEPSHEDLRRALYEVIYLTSPVKNMPPPQGCACNAAPCGCFSIAETLPSPVPLTVKAAVTAVRGGDHLPRPALGRFWDLLRTLRRGGGTGESFTAEQVHEMLDAVIRGYRVSDRTSFAEVVGGSVWGPTFGPREGMVRDFQERFQSELRNRFCAVEIETPSGPVRGYRFAPRVDPTKEISPAEWALELKEDAENRRNQLVEGNL
jgi:hypothetical protein